MIDLYISFLSLILGGIIKLYDEIIDTNIDINIFYIDCIKAFMIGIITILFLFDNQIIIFWGFYGLSHYISTYFCKLYDNKWMNKSPAVKPEDFWNILLIYCIFITVYIFFSKYGFNILNNINYYYVLIGIACFIIMSISCILESIYYMEEVSNKKIYSRLIQLLIYLMIIYYSSSIEKYTNISNLITYILLSCIGYNIIWFLCKFIILKKPDKIKSVKKKKRHSKQKVQLVTDQK